MSERTSQDVLRELRAAVETLPEGQVRDHTTGKVYGTAQVSRLAVLALIDKAIAEAPDTLSEKPGLDVERLARLEKLEAAIRDIWRAHIAEGHWCSICQAWAEYDDDKSPPETVRLGSTDSEDR